jgi:hypothetical protein
MNKQSTDCTGAAMTPHKASTVEQGVVPCRCGAAAEVDWSGCMETYGKAFQFVTARCTSPECMRSVSAEIDSDREDGRVAEHAVVTAWNAIATHFDPGLAPSPSGPQPTQPEEAGSATP